MVVGYLLWAYQQRFENLVGDHTALKAKVREGERAIVENFGIIGKKFTKLEHEIKDAKRITTGKTKEAVKAATQLERRRELS